ncbi:MAG: hypothetical protein ABSG25_13890, partial [Bryobacteraceae bacterium]
MDDETSSVVPIEMSGRVEKSIMTDYLTILLSTDWFLPHWAEIGIDLAEDKKVGIQQGCREIVDEILDGADDFFLGDFSEERMRRTNSSFLALLRRWDVEHEVSATWKEWANLTHADLTAAFFAADLNRKVCSLDTISGTPQLELTIRAEVVKAWEAYD